METQFLSFCDAAFLRYQPCDLCCPMSESSCFIYFAWFSNINSGGLSLNLIISSWLEAGVQCISPCDMKKGHKTISNKKEQLKDF